MPTNDDDLATILGRLDRLAEQWAPQRAQGRTPETTGLMRWVRILYVQIEAWRADGWTWRNIADLFNDAEISLKRGRWTADKLRAAFSQERQRRCIQTSSKS